MARPKQGERDAAQHSEEAELQPQKPKSNAPDLSGIDYSNMMGNNMIEYCKLLQSRRFDEQLVFEVFKVSPIKQVRYEGVEGSPIDVVGFTKVNDKPVKTTKVAVKHALEFNGMLKEGRNWATIEGGQWANQPIQTPGEYYLIKKAQ